MVSTTQIANNQYWILWISSIEKHLKIKNVMFYSRYAETDKDNNDQVAKIRSKNANESSCGLEFHIPVIRKVTISWHWTLDFQRQVSELNHLTILGFIQFKNASFLVYRESRKVYQKTKLHSITFRLEFHKNWCLSFFPILAFYRNDK